MKRATDEGSDLEAALPLELGAGLANEPRLLSDPRLLGALHAELEARESRPDAARSLYQMGLLQGLRDALRADALVGDAARPEAGGRGAAPLLLIALEPSPRGAPEGEVSIVGRWPQAHEAGARITRLGRSADPVCDLSAGYTTGWYSGLLERDLLAVEQSCVARGDADCRFELRDAEVWRERQDPRALWLLGDLPFPAFRTLAARSQEATPAARPAPEPACAAEDAPVVHVWGPVMVIPFSSAEEALRALDLIGRDRAACEVSVVILDLTDAVLDEGFGTAALDLVVSTTRGWGAEPVLAGLSPLMLQATADLEIQGVAIYKDLPFAIASAFQIVRAQGRTV